MKKEPFLGFFIKRLVVALCLLSPIFAYYAFVASNLKFVLIWTALFLVTATLIARYYAKKERIKKQRGQVW